MPNKCTKCGKMHADDANYLLSTGCDACGGRFFFFVRDELVKEVDREVSQISKKEMKEIERDIREIIPVREKSEDKTVVLDIEAIRVLKPGKYHIDVTTLFNQRPVIVRVGTGKYEIDLSTIAAKFGGKEKAATRTP
ncbi:Zn-ribbon containing protein [uncultured archaeon]|nr:Zn-ribbon containing protein [uncultured archaeon]